MCIDLISTVRALHDDIYGLLRINFDDVSFFIGHKIW